MEKAIVVISGEWKNKKKFNKIARKLCFVRNENVGNRLKNDLEESVEGRIEAFLQDDSDEKVINTDRCTKVFSRALLILHYIGRELTEVLKETNGIIQIHITNKDDLSTKIEDYDVVLYSDDPNFENEVQRVIDILTNTKSKNQTENSTKQQTIIKQIIINKWRKFKHD
jgi:hypothetical protein